MDAIRGHPAITGLVIGLIGTLMAILLSPGGDLVRFFVAEVVVVSFAVGLYLGLRRSADGS